MLGAGLLAIGLVAVLLALAKRTGKQKAFNVGIAGAAVFVVGYFMGGVPALMGLAVAPQAPPVGPAKAIWSVVWDSSLATDGAIFPDSTVSPASSYVYSADEKTLDIYNTAVGYTDIADGDRIFPAAVVRNMNSGSVNDIWAYDGAIASVGSVVDQNAGTSFALLQKDANAFWEVAYTGMAGSQLQDKFSSSLVSQDSETIDISMLANGGAFDALVVGSTYSIVLTIAGTSLTMSLHITG